MATSILHQNFPGVEALQKAADGADFIIGLDLHKKTTAICVIDPKTPDNPVLQRKRLRNEDLLAKIASFPGKKVVACEAAYGWFGLRDALAPLPDVTLVLLDPRKTSSWIATSGVKNDKIDAQVLCYTCLQGGIGRLAVHQPNPHARECFKLVQHRDQLVQQRTRIKNQLKAVERDCGVNPFTGEIPEQSDLTTGMKTELLDQLQDLERRVERAEKQMATLSKDDATVALLRSIPGIGPITAFALRHKMETVDRFKTPAHLSSYFGFGVRQRQSGNQLVKGKVTKAGNPLIRKLLVQGAHTIRFRHPDYLALYFPRMGQETLMKNRRHANKVVTAVARKNLSFAFHIWKNQALFDIEKYRERRKQFTSSASPSKAAELEICPVHEGRA